MAQQGILWQLVSGFDPLGQRGLSGGVQQAEKRQTLLEQLAGQREDRQFNQQRDQRNFEWQQQESQRNQGNWERQFGQNAANQNAMRALQQRQFDLQERTANTADIRAINMPDGSQQLVRINKQTGVPEPISIPNQQQQGPAALPPVPNGLDPKTWRVEQTKNIVKDLDNAPKAVTTADNMLKTIDSILKDPALPNATGAFRFTQNIPGTPMFRFGTKAEQLQGQAFLQAYEYLRGTGAIANIEGEKATGAIGRLKTAQSADDYKEALNELREVVSSARQRQIDLQNRYLPQQQQTQQIQNGAIAVNPTTGQRIQFQNGQWVPAQ